MIVAAGLLWSTGGLLLKWVEWNSMAIAGVRSAIAAITVYAFTHAIKKVKALEATLLLMIEPVLNPIWVMIFFHEKPGPWSLLGCSIVLVTATFRGVLTAHADSKP